jgi:hypothetical protein
MARTTRARGKRSFQLARRLLAPVGEGVGLLKNVGMSALKTGKKVFGAGVGFAGNVVRSTGRRVNNTVRGVVGRRKTRRNTRKNRSRSRR